MGSSPTSCAWYVSPWLCVMVFQCGSNTHTHIGSIHLAGKAKNPPQPWIKTLAPTVITNLPVAEIHWQWQTGVTVVAQSGNKCASNSWIFFKEGVHWSFQCSTCWESVLYLTQGWFLCRTRMQLVALPRLSHQKDHQHKDTLQLKGSQLQKPYTHSSGYQSFDDKQRMSRPILWFSPQYMFSAYNWQNAYTIWQ